MDKVAIISIIYSEPEWAETERCIDACELPKFYVNRHGVGSLAKAINSGFRQWSTGFEWIWFVTNIVFKPSVIWSLLNTAQSNEYAAVGPCFNSDHLFCQPSNQKGTLHASVPFLEFTAPLVRAEVFRKFLLDENMPYWGHDLDWGHRLRKAGYKLGVDYTAKIDHTYIRNNKDNHGVTRRRAQLRKQTNASTRDALISKYGTGWRKVLCYM